MRNILLILFIFFPIIISGQSNVNEEISTVAEKITGKWILKRYECDSLVKEWSFNAGKYFINICKNKKIIKSEEIDGFYMRVMSFENSGFGTYEDYFDYKSESKANVDYGIEEVSEIPELIFNDGEVMIKTTHLYGNEDTTQIVKLNKKELILFKAIGIKWIYERMK